MNQPTAIDSPLTPVPPHQPPHATFPWWMGYLLASPLRRLRENPDKTLAPHVRAGMTVLDVGCAMGFFSLPMAKLVGSTGRVICVDMQERMIRPLRKRIRGKGFEDCIETHVCSPATLGIDDLDGRIDFLLAYHVVHETLSQDHFLRQCFTALRDSGRMLFAEPTGHVTAVEFQHTLRRASGAGFVEVEFCSPGSNQVALLEKPRRSS